MIKETVKDSGSCTQVTPSCKSPISLINAVLPLVLIYKQAVSFGKMLLLSFVVALCSQIRAMKKRNLEEVHDGFPTNGIKYETKDANYRHESVTNKELQKEVKRLQSLLEKVKCCEVVVFLTKLLNLSHVL